MGSRITNKNKTEAKDRFPDEIYVMIDENGGDYFLCAYKDLAELEEGPVAVYKQASVGTVKITKEVV